MINSDAPQALSDALPCPSCSTATVSVRDAQPWCPDCEWNLDRYEPDRRAPEFGWRWVDRRTHQLAYRLTRAAYRGLAERSLTAQGLGAAGVVTVVASVLLLAAVLAFAVTGVWILVTYRFPSPILLIGLTLIGVAVVLRPRLGRLDPDLEVLTPDRAPELLALVREVAEAIGAPMPHVVGVDGDFNAYTRSVGWRRRRVLCLGLPLWGALAPQERVALLGHELGHFVNGDIRRRLVTQPAFTMLGSAADLVRPVPTFQVGGIAGMVGDAFARAVQWLLSRLLFAGHLLLVAVALRDSQRAEYLADEMAARAAGSAASVRLLDRFLLNDAIQMLVRRDARAGHGPARWRATAATAVTANEVRLPSLRQLSVRDEVSLFASHPPTGLRSGMLAARPWRDEPAVMLAEERSERIDAELARDYDRTRRSLAWVG